MAGSADAGTTASGARRAATARLTPTACLICGATGARVLQAYDRPDPYEQAVGVAPDGYARAWVACTGCGFCYARYSRDPEILDRIYAEAYRDRGAAWRQQSVEETFARVVALPAAQSETHARIAWIKAEIHALAGHGLLGWPAPPYRMLDVGGATGVFAYLFRDERWQSAAIDPSEAGRFLERQHGIPYKAAPFAPGAFGRRFHLIALVFVLEHLRAPLELLRAAADDLEPGGLVYLEVPDAAAFGRRPPEDDIFNACHLWMFAPASLHRLVDQAGLEVCSLQRTQTLRGHLAIRLLAQRRAG